MATGSMNKKEASELLNNIFGTSIKWEKLSKAELEQLIEVLNNSRKVLKITLRLVSVEDIEEELMKVMAKTVRKQVKDKVTGKGKFEILNYLKKIIEDKL